VIDILLAMYIYMNNLLVLFFNLFFHKYFFLIFGQLGVIKV